MYGEVWVESEATDSLAVPAEAVVDTGTLRYVFLARAGGVFEPRRVRLGAQADGFVQVLDGVSEGDLVVTSANFLLDSESRLLAPQIAGGAQAGAPAAAPPPQPSAHGAH
jgi:Cu(I)/Ag(I) efflux system membrane fusion protein